MKQRSRQVSSMKDNPWTPPVRVDNLGGHPGQPLPVQVDRRVWTGSDNFGHPWTGQEEKWA